MIKGPIRLRTQVKMMSLRRLQTHRVSYRFGREKETTCVIKGPIRLLTEQNDDRTISESQGLKAVYRDPVEGGGLK